MDYPAERSAEEAFILSIQPKQQGGRFSRLKHNITRRHHELATSKLKYSQITNLGWFHNITFIASLAAASAHTFAKGAATVAIATENGTTAGTAKDDLLVVRKSPVAETAVRHFEKELDKSIKPFSFPVNPETNSLPRVLVPTRVPVSWWVCTRSSGAASQRTPQSRAAKVKLN